MTIGQFVRVRDAHPLAGMTGRVVAIDGGEVQVALSARRETVTLPRIAVRPEVYGDARREVAA